MPPRCFVALTLPGDVIRALASAREVLAARAPGWAGERWVRPDNLHVTVAFLGALDDKGLEDRVTHMRSAVASVPAFDLPLSGVTAVPSPRRSKMLWAALHDGSGSMTLLRDAVLEAFPEAEAARGKMLRPHVTLVRTRSPRRIGREALSAASSLVAEAGKDPEGIVSVRSATLFSSTLLPGGPEYREIAVAPLAR